MLEEFGAEKVFKAMQEINATSRAEKNHCPIYTICLSPWKAIEKNVPYLFHPSAIK